MASLLADLPLASATVPMHKQSIAEYPCQVFSKNLKVQPGRIPSYLDILVTCEHDFSADQAVFTTPVLVIEVLSPSTQAYDRSKKFAMYRQLELLREYGCPKMAVDPDSQRRRSRQLEAVRHERRRCAVLESIDGAIALADVFNGMDKCSRVSCTRGANPG